MNLFFEDLMQNQALVWGLGLPTWVITVILVVCIAAFFATLVFKKHLDKYAQKVGISMDQVEPVVKTMAKFAIQLFVMKQGLQETRRINQMRVIAETLDKMYAPDSTLRISELVRAMDAALLRNAVHLDLEAKERVELVKQMADKIVNEVQTVGTKVNDNENDPIIRPSDVSRWIQTTIDTIHVAKQKQARF